jgi:hypothetical protein
MNRTLLVALAFVVGASAVALTAVRVVADDSAKPPVAPPVAPPAAPSDAAKAAKEEKVRKLIRLQGGEDLARKSLDKMLDQFKGMPGLPAGFAEKFREKANLTELANFPVPAYVKHLDDSTLDAAIAFYESPEGRKLAAQLPAIQMESMDAGAAWGRKLGMEVAAELASGKK